LTLEGNSGGKISPDGTGNINTVGTGSITTIGSGNTLTTELTGLTSNAILYGQGSATIGKVTVVDNGVLITSSAGAPSLLANGTTGQVLTATTGSPPSWENASSGGITTIDGDSGQITGTTVTIRTNVASLNCGSTVEFVNGTATSTLNVTDSNNNTLIGSGSGTASVSGIYNSALGRLSLASLTSGNYNVSLGSPSLQSLSTGLRNVAVGFEALNNFNGNDTTAIGYQALTSLTSGSSNNAYGSASQAHTTTGQANCTFGQNTLTASSTNSYNSAFGFEALQNISGDQNTVIGCSAMAQGTGTATQNCIAGYESGLVMTNAEGNCGWGYASLYQVTSGDYNCGYGYETEFNLVSGSYNSSFGYNAGSQHTTNDSSNICIGNVGVAGDNNSIRIGTQGSGSAQQNTCYIAGIRGTSISGPPVNCNTFGQLGTASNYQQIIKTSTVDFTKTGLTLLFTSPANAFLSFDFIEFATLITTSSGVATFNIGWTSPDYSDYYYMDITNVTTTGAFYNAGPPVSSSGNNFPIPPSTAVYCNVLTADVTAVARMEYFYILGFYAI
jgi:trimeric autotransporter adhesin